MNAQEILESLEPLFERAEKEGLLFRSYYQACLFTPAQLREKHAKGEFIWGPCNWEMVSVEEIKRDFENRASWYKKQILDMEKQIESYEAEINQQAVTSDTLSSNIIHHEQRWEEKR